MTHPVPHAASLDTAYSICRGLHRTHGRSYYLATKLLPAWKRRHVHALYGFTRYTDDIVDAGGDIEGPHRARRLGEWADQFGAAIEGIRAPADPVLLAVRHTVATFGLSRADFDAFFASMRMDLHVRAYADYEALLGYMQGSAAVIGTMMLPILLAPDDGPGPVTASAMDRAREPARQLGLAFQLTNFIRDVAEDLDRDRVYLPADDLARFGVNRDDLAAPSASPAVRRLIAFEVEPGPGPLPPGPAGPGGAARPVPPLRAPGLRRLRRDPGPRRGGGPRRPGRAGRRAAPAAGDRGGAGTGEAGMTVNAEKAAVLAPDDVTFVTGELRPYLADLLGREQATWKELAGASWADLPQALAAYLGGGKALRPRFCYWGHALAGQDASPLLRQACAALELLHTFALIHDDLMDNSDTRRGRPALHREIAAQHRRDGRAGDPDQYGRALALLAGDLAFSVASRLAAALPAPAVAVWNRMVGELVLGQFLDLAGAARQDRSREVARATTLLKSGQYTVTSPLRLGAALGGHPGAAGRPRSLR